MSQSLIEKMAEILECSPSELDSATDFRNHPHWDSLAALSTIAMLDSEYEITLSQNEFEGLETIGELDTYILKHTDP